MRVVSLVPSATETILELGVRPVACTRFCDQPGIPTVGGTKDPDVAAVIAARPDLVVVNNEENRRVDADALLDAGLAVHDCSPRSVADVGPAVAARPSPVRAQDEEGGGQGVGLRGGRRQGGGAGRALGRPAGARIENVAQLSTLVF